LLLFKSVRFLAVARLRCYTKAMPGATQTQSDFLLSHANPT